MTAKKRVLVIDDDASVRQTICEIVEICGYEAFGAGDGESGLALLNESNLPHIVITDIIMPHKEGLETIMEIRKKFPNIKIIAISGGGRTKVMDYLAMAKKLGCDAVITKPIDIREFEKTLKDIAN